MGRVHHSYHGQRLHSSQGTRQSTLETSLYLSLHTSNSIPAIQYQQLNPTNSIPATQYQQVTLKIARTCVYRPVYKVASVSPMISQHTYATWATSRLQKCRSLPLVEQHWHSMKAKWMSDSIGQTLLRRMSVSCL